MMRLIPILLLATSCSTQTYDCGDVDVEATRVLIVDAYPDVVDIYDRMDIYCREDTDTVQTCGLAGYKHTEGCTMWLGGGPYRGKMFHDIDEDFSTSVLEKAQHWHLMRVNGDNGCPTHEAACGWKD